MLVHLLSACGGGGGGGSSAPAEIDDTSSDLDQVLNSSGGFPELAQLPVNNAAMDSCKSTAAIPTGSNITGVVEYQRVPLPVPFAGSRGLDYANTVELPARGVVVQAVEAIGGSCSESVVATGLTNSRGEYGLTVPVNQPVCVEVRAQLYRDASNGGAGWDVQMVDNTNASAAYYLTDRSIIATSDEQPIRNFLAASGAEGGMSVYSAERAAAPFAILDTICEAIDTLVAVDAEIDLPTLLVNWSSNNVVAEGDVEAGEIGGAFYRATYLIRGNTVTTVGHEIFLLGDEGVNTDEYDSHVITHEFGHFVTGALSRFDALGGEHFLGDSLDMRLAFEEGWADAFSAIALDGATTLLTSPQIYRDSSGDNQGRAFYFSLDNNPYNRGWYSESSVYSTLYNSFDSSNDSIDTLSLGFASLYDVLTNAAYKNSAALLSVYTFFNRLKQLGADAVAIDMLLADEDIEPVVDDYGSNEDIANNDGMSAREDVFPLYHELLLNTDVTVCSNDQFGLANKLSVNQYLRFNAASSKTYRFEITPLSTSAQALLELYQRGNLLGAESYSASARGESLVADFTLSGEYVILLSDVNNADPESDAGGRRCFTVRVKKV
jgi:hypothetical protein